MYEVLLDESHKKLRDEVRKFVRDEVEPELLIKMDSNEQEYPYEFIKKATKRNLIGLRFPKEYGGRGLNWTHEILALEEVGVLGIGVSCAYALPSICGEALNIFGTKEQKERYLKPTLNGDLICAEGLTEPRSGSDFFGTITTAVKKGDKFILNGEKRFVAGGVGADWFIIYAKTDFNSPPHESLSAFIVERDFGVKVEEQYQLMGCRGMGAARIIFKDLEVPEENLIGTLNKGAEIFNQMMIPERLTTAAGAIGIGRACLELAVRYSAKREAFGRPISRFEGINFKIAECATLLDASRGLTYHAAKRADAKLSCRKEVSMAKYFSTEAGFRTASEAMQILGGIGYTDVYPIERLFRDARLGTIWTGSNEVQRLIVQSEVYKQILREDKNIKRNIELDTPGANKTIEKVFKEDINKYMPK
ncbi:MAG: acyl-CoA dehydrogenase family protein [Candidatus Helarchaeota archaeon]